MIYLLHLERPLSPDHTSQHYTGYADNARTFHNRLKAHTNGQSKARYMEVAAERGIAFALARVWHGDRTDERRLKDQHNAPRLCPICRGVEPFEAWDPSIPF